MLRIITANTNGIRSAAKKGFLQWLSAQDADIVCIQELKAQAADLSADYTEFPGYRYYAHYAEKKGYSGCAVYSRIEPKQVRIGFGNEEFDAEGRYVELEFDNLILVSVYIPSGSSSEERQAAKFRFLDAFLPHLRELKARGKEVVFCGDVNIAHKEIDIKNWKGNLKNSGFLPEERGWLDNLFGQEGWVDVFRTLEKGPDLYTWWSNRGQARAKNVGWRIDYQIATPAFAASARSTSIYNEERFSDHAPLIVDYEWNISDKDSV